MGDNLNLIRRLAGLPEASEPRPLAGGLSSNLNENLNNMRHLAGLPEVTQLVEDVYIPKGTPWEIDPETGQRIIPDSLKQLQLLHQKNNPGLPPGWGPPPPVLPKPRQPPQKIPDAPQVPGNRGQGSGDTRSNASPPVIPTVPPTNRANPNTPNAAAPVARPPDKSWIDSLKLPDWGKEWSKTWGDDPDHPPLPKPKDQPKKSLFSPEIDKSIDDVGSAIGGAGSAIGGAIGGAGSAIKQLWRGGDAPAAPTAPNPVEPVTKAEPPSTDDWDWRKTLGLFDPRKPLPKSWEPPAKVATPEPQPAPTPYDPAYDGNLGYLFRPYSRPKEFDPLVTDDDLEPVPWGQLLQRPTPVPQKQAQQPNPQKKVPNTDSPNGAEQPPPQPGEKAPPGTKNEPGHELKKEPEIPPQAGPGRFHFPLKDFFAPDGRSRPAPMPIYPPDSGVDPGDEDPQWVKINDRYLAADADMRDMRKLAGLPPAEPVVEKEENSTTSPYGSLIPPTATPSPYGSLIPPTAPPNPYGSLPPADHFPLTGKNPPSPLADPEILPWMRDHDQWVQNQSDDNLAHMKRLAGLG
jgi:hypothetical protein